MFIYIQYADVITKALPQVTMTITQSLGSGHPLLDGTALRLVCKASNSSSYSLDKFVDMKWTGIGLWKKSLWVKESRIDKYQNAIVKALLFHPCLEYHAGEYTCHLTVKDENNSTFMINKTVELKSK